MGKLSVSSGVLWQISQHIHRAQLVDVWRLQHSRESGRFLHWQYHMVGPRAYHSTVHSLASAIQQNTVLEAQREPFTDPWGVGRRNQGAEILPPHE